MPELPEVETTRRGLIPWLTGRRVRAIHVRQPRLRWRVSTRLVAELTGQEIRDVRRRAKYLLLVTDAGTAIVHLGMTGSLRTLSAWTEPGPHDHIDLALSDGGYLRYRDPRRFGSWHWTRTDALRHRLLAGLGPEPHDPAFTGVYLHRRARGRKVPVKPFLMDAGVVVGVGNIYASEALWRAGIHPRRPAGRISEARYAELTRHCVAVLDEAIAAGGTTLRDFRDAAGEPGYFSHDLAVYDQRDKPCRRCATPLRREVIGQRASYFCPVCQR